MPEPDLKGFVEALFENGIDSWDGDELQDLGEKYGVLRKEWRKVPCSEYCRCSEVCDSGDTVECYRFAWRAPCPNHHYGAGGYCPFCKTFVNEERRKQFEGDAER